MLFWFSSACGRLQTLRKKKKFRFSSRNAKKTPVFSRNCFKTKEFASADFTRPHGCLRRANWCFSSRESDGKLSLPKLNKLQLCRKMRSYLPHDQCISLIINLTRVFNHFAKCCALKIVRSSLWAQLLCWKDFFRVVILRTTLSKTVGGETLEIQRLR